MSDYNSPYSQHYETISSNYRNPITYGGVYNSIDADEYNQKYRGGGSKTSGGKILKQRKITRETMKAATRALLQLTAKNRNKRHPQTQFGGARIPNRLIARTDLGKGKNASEFEYNAALNILSQDEIEKLNDAFHQYYKLKTKYDDAVHSIKKDQHRGLTRKLVKPKCVNCRQEGGTVFKNEDGILTAHCGNISQPCGLNIQINRGKYESLEELMKQSHEDVKETMERIIRMKLDVLFDFITQDEVAQKVDSIIKELNEQQEIYAEFRKYYFDVTDNTEKKEELATIMERIRENEAKIRDIMAEFSETENRALIDDVLLIYQDNLEPLYKEFALKKYVYRNIETTDNEDGLCVPSYIKGEFYIIQKTYSYNELYVPVVVPSVISNVRVKV